MILTQEMRSKFTIFVFVQDIEGSADLRGHLAVLGYEVFMFRDQSTLVDRVRESAPHLVVFEIEALEGTLSDFVEAVLGANSEVGFLPMVSMEQIGALEPYREYNFYQVLPRGEDLDLRLSWAVDQCCSELLLQYQNEKLFDQTRELEAKLRLKDQSIEDLKGRTAQLAAVEPFDLKNEISAYARAGTREEIFDIFMRRIVQKFLRKNQEVKGLALRFLPTVQSFVAVQAQGLDLEKIKGVGARLERHEGEDLLSFLGQGKIPSQLTSLMSVGLGVKNFHAVPILLPSSVEALVLFWTKQGAFHFSEIENEASAFSLIYQNAFLQRKLSEVDTKDVVTGLENIRTHQKSLVDEVERARRLQKAVSVIKISIDHIAEIRQSVGEAAKNAVLKSIAEILKQTGRVNDVVSRTGDNEFSLVLPHSARKGAAVRAERIRRMIEKHTFQVLDQKVTLSLGVSEYPSLCRGADDLDKTAQQALEYIHGRGGNKVCLFRAPPEHQPDFNVPVT